MMKGRPRPRIRRPTSQRAQDREVAAFVGARRVGHLATVDAEHRPVVVPFCFAFDGKTFYSSLDEKPKGVSPNRLRRTRNILGNPEVALVVDHYDEDWAQLEFALVRGKARVLYSGKEHGRAVALLRKKYPQYRKMRLEHRPIVKIVPWRIYHWNG